MNIKQILLKALIGVLFFILVTVVLNGDYSREAWLQKGTRGLIFGGIYVAYLVIKEKFKKKEV